MSANQVAVLDTKPSVIRRVAERFGVDPDKMLATLKATAFRGAGEISNEQMMALLVVADAHGLNPWLRELYAFPSQNGIVPIVGIDGWLRLCNSHPQFDGMEFAQDDEKCTCTIYRKDRSHPIVVTEYMAECSRNTGPWKTHPKRMLRWKATIQCARVAFSYSGIFDPDEGERIIEAEAVNVTPIPRDADEEGRPTINAAQGRKLVSPVKLRKIIEGLLAAVEAKDGKALWAILNENEMTKDTDAAHYIWGELRSYEARAIRDLSSATRQYANGMDLDAWSLTLLRGVSDGPSFLAAWDAIQGAYQDRDLEVSPDVQTVAQDLKQSLAVP